MAFEKGNTFGKGRPKGAKNRNTTEIRQLITDFVGNYYARDFEKDFKRLDASQRLKFITDLTKFAIPTLRSISGSLDDLSEEQFEQLYQRFKAEYQI